MSVTAAGARRPSRALLMTKIDGRYLLKCEFWLFLLVNSAVSFGVLPSALLYVFDVVNIAVFVVSYKRCCETCRNMKWALTVLGIYLLYCLASGACFLVAPQYVIWELNSVFRLFVFMMLWGTFCDVGDLLGVLRVLYRLQVLNFACSAAEFFLFGLQGDNCGGLFGTIAGCNAAQNIYLCVVVGYAMSSYLARDGVKIVGLALTCTMALALATFSELKFFYIEFVVIMAVCLLASRFSFKTALLTCVGVAAVVIGLNLLATYYPDSYELLFDVDALEAYDDGSQVATSGYGISRSAPVEQIDRLFFSFDPVERAAGYGFGSATMSSIGFFSTPFYHSYGFLYYYYSPIAMLYLQTGWIGLLGYFAFFACQLVYLVRMRDELGSRSPLLFGFAMAMLVMFAANCFYNATARSSLAIVWAVVMSAPLLVSKLGSGDGEVTSHGRG